MNKIEAVIKPFKLDEVKAALNAIGVTGMTIFEAKGYGRQRGHKEVYRGAEYQCEFVPKLTLNIVAEESQTERIIDTIQKTANTGKIGDGKIFVLPVQDTIRIRTGETGTEAV
jgi:nitrogen regulatory protein P-II 1